MLKSMNFQSGPVRFLRRIFGLLFLIIGILGILLPIIPGWPGIFIAIILLGRRDPLLRHLHLLCRRALRYLRTTRHNQVRRLGKWLSGEYVSMRTMIRPRILQAERFFG